RDPVARLHEPRTLGDLVAADAVRDDVHGACDGLADDSRAELSGYGCDLAMRCGAGLRTVPARVPSLVVEAERDHHAPRKLAPHSPRSSGAFPMVGRRRTRGWGG